jgi:predicted secreted protein
MAIKTFTVAAVKINGTAGTTLTDVDSANLTVNMDTGETTGFGDTWKEYVALAKSWQLTVAGKLDPVGTAVSSLRTEFISGDNIVTSVVMMESASSYFSGDTILTSYTEGASVNGVDTYSCTFQGNGALSYTP